MSSFGIALLALSAAIAPGVIFIVCFFYFSSIQRSGISFGPAVDLALFFAISLLINGFYGGIIESLVSLTASCAARSPNWLLFAVNFLLHQEIPGACPETSFIESAYLYLMLLCIFSAIIGSCTIALTEAMGVSLAHNVFSRLASNRRWFGVTTCSALCKFGGTAGHNQSYVTYIGRFQGILLSDKHEIRYVSLKNVRRSILRVGFTVTSLPKSQRTLLTSAQELVIPGEAVENVAFFHARPTKPWLYLTITLSFLRLLLLLAPAAYSLSVYAAAGDLSPPPSPTSLCDNTCSNAVTLSNPALNAILEWEKDNKAATARELDALTNAIKSLTLKLTATRLAPESTTVFTVLFDPRKTDLSDTEKAVLKRAADYAVQHHSTQIRLNSYADTTGSELDNLVLSQRRADTVRNALINLGLPADQIQFEFYGSHNLPVPTQASVSEPRNRSVDIMVN